jgi:hypothetical protein
MQSCRGPEVGGSDHLRSGFGASSGTAVAAWGSVERFVRSAAGDRCPRLFAAASAPAFHGPGFGRGRVFEQKETEATKARSLILGFLRFLLWSHLLLSVPSGDWRSPEQPGTASPSHDKSNGAGSLTWLAGHSKLGRASTEVPAPLRATPGNCLPTPILPRRNLPAICCSRDWRTTSRLSSPVRDTPWRTPTN